MEEPKFTKHDNLELPRKDESSEGFVKRWREKLKRKKPESDLSQQEQTAPEPESSQFKRRISALPLKELIEKPASEQAEKNTAELIAEIAQIPIEKLKKVGNKVLHMAEAAIAKVEQAEQISRPETAALHELEDAKEDLAEEIKDLGRAEERLITAEENFVGGEKAPAKVISQEEVPDSEPSGFEAPSHASTRASESFVERTEIKIVEAKKQTLADIATTAIMAFAGGALFMTAIEKGTMHASERRRLKRFRALAKKEQAEQQEVNEIVAVELAEQKQALQTQEQELAQLKRREVGSSAKSRVEFLNDVREVTEHQAEITHQVVKQVEALPIKLDSKIGLEAKPELLRSVDRKEPGEVVREKQPTVLAEASAEKASHVKAKDDASFSATGGGAVESLQVPKNATESQVKKAIKELEKQSIKKQQRQQATWLATVFFATMVAILAIWLIYQLVLSSL